MIFFFLCGKKQSFSARYNLLDIVNNEQSQQTFDHYLKSLKNPNNNMGSNLSYILDKIQKKHSEEFQTNKDVK